MYWCFIYYSNYNLIMVIIFVQFNSLYLFQMSVSEMCINKLTKWILINQLYSQKSKVDYNLGQIKKESKPIFMGRIGGEKKQRRKTAFYVKRKRMKDKNSSIIKNNSNIQKKIWKMKTTTRNDIKCKTTITLRKTLLIQKQQDLKLLIN